MKIYILTIFPELFTNYFKNGLVKKSIENGLIEFESINFRDFTEDAHKTVDDIPFSGGSGMVIKPEPVIKAYLSIPSMEREKALKIVPSARGNLFVQSAAEQFARQDFLIFFAGRYKGFDQRIVELMDAREYSIGDYVVQGGEIPVLAMLDASLRLIPNFIGDRDSAASDSFADSVKLLSAPDYTRPREFMGKSVPNVLLSGDHAKISQWKHREGLRLTMERRPDLIPQAQLTEEDFDILDELKADAHKSENENNTKIL
ncbi:tRNA (guanosine(37)-N1)-methyltransferase TrmD [bacterium]|nr:tRNA (guanosine(37)-N1)-methyltransferase TrmD [bacterium]